MALSRDKVAAATSPDPRSATFDELFCAAAARVLKRRGVPARRIPAEIERLRRAEPLFRGPDFDTFAKAQTERADKG